MSSPSVSAIFDEEHYAEARRNRMTNLLAHIDIQRLAGMNVVELGCGAGDLGEELARRGAIVTSVDAVDEHLRALKQRYPSRTVRQVDLERLDPRELGRFDAILCFGLLYHLATPTIFLQSCAAMADELWLETVVQDAVEPVCQIVVEQGPDQAFSGFGCRPSPAWLELTLRRAGYEHIHDISTSTANWGGPSPSAFDWRQRDDGSWLREGALLRRMLIAKRLP
jgi:SAM-dependent methyltransferase